MMSISPSLLMENSQYSPMMKQDQQQLNIDMSHIKSENIEPSDSVPKSDSTSKPTTNGDSSSSTSKPKLSSNPTAPGATAKSGSVQPSAPGKEPIAPRSTIVKTDKPRPHVCGVCTRSFARLEHLKRHERSHTKEKPFQCPVCERCFARRDLLLRHKQKLHANFDEDDVESARRAHAKRAKTDTSSSSKTAASNSQGPAIKPNKNISMKGQGNDNGLLTSTGPSQNQQQHQFLADGSAASATTHPYSNLLKSQMHTRHRNASFSATSATSYTKIKDIAAFNEAEIYPEGPSQVGFSTPQLLATTMDESAIDDFFGISDPLFINPQLLDGSDDVGGGPHSIFKFNSDRHAKNHLPTQNDVSPPHIADTQIQFHPAHRHSLGNMAGPMPPHAHSQQQRGDDFHMWDPNGDHPFNTAHPAAHPPSQQQQQHPQPQPAGPGFSPTPSISALPPHIISPHPSNLSGGSECGSSPGLDYPESVASSSVAPDFGSGTNNGDWMHNLRSHSQSSHISNHPQSQLQHLQPQHQDPLAILHNALDDGSKSLTSPTMNLSNIHLNDPLSQSPHLQQHLQHQQQQQQQQQQPQQPQPHAITCQLRMHVLTLLSAPTPFALSQTPQLPAAPDLQRYIDAYYMYFGRHLPFLHHSLTFTPDNVPLALGMAAIGALYLFEPQTSMSIFEISRSCIHIYLESRRERRVLNNATPLWLVQALILGVIYGLFSSETLANEIAVAQANAVVSLAKSAGLQFPVEQYVDMSTATLPGNENVHGKWSVFIEAQGRIRTMHVVHIISCLLGTSHNISSSLRNSEIMCGCPCDESLWNAASASEWWDLMAKKGLTHIPATGSSMSFTDCLNGLLAGNALVEKVSQFTLLSLMYGLHLEILERRRNVMGSPHNASGAAIEPSEHTWQTDKVRLESVLRLWETTWSLSPLASLSPSSQYGPIMSDAIPLSSLAHVRIYIDLRKAKEAFWKRDFVAMNQEIDLIPNSQGLFEAASFAADAISLWEKHAVKWTLEATATQTFIHTLVALFDCGIAVSEFLRRMQMAQAQNGGAGLGEDQALLVSRIGKILYRVLDIVGYSDELHQPLNEDGTLKHGTAAIAADQQLSNIALGAVARILSVKCVWPYALVLSDALTCRSSHLTSMN